MFLHANYHGYLSWLSYKKEIGMTERCFILSIHCFVIIDCQCFVYRIQ